MPESILICGRNPTLLLTRTLVLEHAGFRVKALSGLLKLRECAEDRVLLCSSLSESEQLEAIRLIREGCPEAKILVVGEDRVIEDDKVFRMSALSGAEILIENTKFLLQ